MIGALHPGARRPTKSPISRLSRKTRGAVGASPALKSKQALRIKSGSFAPVDFPVEREPFDFLRRRGAWPPFRFRQIIPRRHCRDIRSFCRGECPGREQPAAIHRQPAAENPADHEDHAAKPEQMMPFVPALIRRRDPALDHFDFENAEHASRKRSKQCRERQRPHRCIPDPCPAAQHGGIDPMRDAADIIPSPFAPRGVADDLTRGSTRRRDRCPLHR